MIRLYIYRQWFLIKKLAFDNGNVCRLFFLFSRFVAISLCAFSKYCIDWKEAIYCNIKIGKHSTFFIVLFLHPHFFLTNEACQILRLKSFVENSIFAYLNFLQFVHIKPIDGFVRICNMSFAKLLWKSIKTTHIQKINLIYPSFVARFSVIPFTNTMYKCNTL